MANGRAVDWEVSPFDILTSYALAHRIAVFVLAVDHNDGVNWSLDA